MRLVRYLALLGMGCLLMSAVAQDSLAPDEIEGEAVYVPFPVAITLDGSSEDWVGVPMITVERGTMTSADPAENGSFSFAVAADETNIYILMTMPDQNIITGLHGADYWNEDLFEFYFNFTSDFLTESYNQGVMQVNVNPGNIGLTDPAALQVTGNNPTGLKVSGIVFKTDDGWGFEGAVPLATPPTHGMEVGFQAQINGATEHDRNVKLIWSLADTADISWNNPSVFGRALFFEIGSEDIPLPSVPEIVEEEEIVRTFVAVNQTGYFTNAIKNAVYIPADKVYGRPVFIVKNVDTGASDFGGATLAPVEDIVSGDTVYPIDFTKFTTPGTYVISINNIDSVPFRIFDDIYDGLKRDSLRYFYHNRSGIPLEAEYAGDAYARPAGHTSDGDVTCFAGTAAGQTFDGCNYRLNAAGGWYDAGDYGKYVVNGGIATWTLLNWYELHPASFADGSLNIPESGNGISDILDEARWEMEWMLSMQVPTGEPLAGMAHHKLHALTWDGLPVLPPTVAQNERLLMPPSTAATLNLAATAAQCARIWRDIDVDFAERCLTAAETAFAAAQANPDLLYGSIPGNGGGDYGDGTVSDEFFWAAAELFITTGEAVYGDFVIASPHFSRFPGGMWWGGTGTLGTISLATIPNGLSEEDITSLRNQIVTAADGYLATIQADGYSTPLQTNDYVWGSSSGVLNNAILIALAYDFTGDETYLNGVVHSMDYLLGHNANNFSFVSGYGTNSMQHPHHRFWANVAPNFPAPPPGAIAGGANGNPADQRAIDEIGELPIPRRYIDHVDSYSTNEVAINWNAPLVWVAAYLNDTFNQ